jgi:hypothetical protein
MILRAAHAMVAIVLAIVVTAPSCTFAQIPDNTGIFSADVGITLAFFHTDRLLYTGSALSDFNRSFLGNAMGVSLWGSVGWAAPVSAQQHVNMELGLDNVHVAREGDVRIPCRKYDKDGVPAVIADAVAHMKYQIDITSVSLAAQLQFASGRVLAGGGLGGRYPLAGRFRFVSDIAGADSCYYNYFSDSRTTHIDGDVQVSTLRLNFPLTIRLAYIIPVANGVFIAPSLGLDVGLFSFDESGATVSAVRPGIGMRFAR